MTQVKTKQERAAPPPWIPISVFIAAFMVTIFMWRALAIRENIQIQHLVSATTSEVKSILETEIKMRIRWLVRMATSWERWGKPLKEQWESDAALYVTHYPGYQGIAWIDPSFSVRWIVPLEGNEAAQDLIAFEEGRRMALAAVRDRFEVAVTHSINVATADKGFIVYVPIFQEEQLNGFISGIFRFRKLCESILAENIGAGYSISLLDGEEEVYSRYGGNGQHEEKWGQETKINIYGVTWRVRVWPNRELLARTGFHLPELALVIGLIITFLVSTAVFLAQTALLRAKQLGEKQRLLEAANTQLKALSALKDEFVANVSHELRIPLTALKEGVSLLLDEILGPITGEQRDFLNLVDENINRLTEIITNLLDLSKIEAQRLILHRRRLGVRELIETTAKTYRPIAGHRTLRVDLPPTPDVFVDSNRILQVLGNLFTNAVKFTKDDGTITFAVREGDGCVSVSVQDDGIGIAQEDVPKLFQKFFQAGEGENRPRGTGLGLALCKQLVDLHKGTFAVHSQLGKGSTFTFKLPVYSAPFALEESFEELIKFSSPQIQGKTIGLIAVATEPLLERLPDAPSKNLIELLEQVREFVRKHTHHGDVVLTVEPQWVTILAVADRSDLEALVRRLQCKLDEWISTLSGKSVNRSVSFGVALYPQDGSDGKSLFQKATGSINQAGLAEASVSARRIP